MDLIYNSLTNVEFRVITLENDDCSFDKYYRKNECLRYPFCFHVLTFIETFNAVKPS